MGQVTKGPATGYPTFSTSTAKLDTGSSIGVQARDVASQVTDQAKALVTTKVTKRQEQTAMDLIHFADALRKKGGELEHSVFAPIAGVTPSGTKAAKAWSFTITPRTRPSITISPRIQRTPVS